MATQEGEPAPNPLDDSLILGEKQTSCGMRLLQKIDFFSFIPVPKDEPVSTKRSMIGSCVFIVLFLIYIIVDFYQFASHNPPVVQNAQSKLNDQWYEMPRIAIAFMKGQYVNETEDFSESFTFAMTKEQKDPSVKNSAPIELEINNKTYLEDWLGSKTLGFYNRLLAPAEPMMARGLLYSTANSNYTKISILMCNLNNPNVTCHQENDIRTLMAQGRIFLFIEESEDKSGIARKQANPNKYRISNFFLIPQLYKRVLIEFQVVKTVELPDYFYRWKTRDYTRLELNSITEQTSNTSINDFNLGKNHSLEMLGITFQLAAQTLNVRITYTTLLDQIAKWGAFFNVLFAVFAIFLLAYNKNKFYKKNPDWDKFKQRRKSGALRSSLRQQQELK